MNKAYELVSGLASLVLFIFIGIYASSLWVFHNFRLEISDFFSSITVNQFLIPLASNNISIALTLSLGYILSIFYLSGTEEGRESKQYPRSQIIMELADNIRFLMALYFAAIFIALFPPTNIFSVILTASIGFLIHTVILELAKGLLRKKVFHKAIIATLFSVFGLVGLNMGGLPAELAVMSLLVGYVQVMQSSSKKYHELVTQDYQFLVRNYLYHKSVINSDSNKIWEMPADDNAIHLIVSKASNSGLLKGGNFAMMVIFGSAPFIFDFSILSLVFILAIFPTTITLLTNFSKSPTGPAKIKGTVHEAVFITNENDREGYYVVLAPEGVEKLRLDNIEGYELYSEEESIKILKKKLDDKDSN